MRNASNERQKGTRFVFIQIFELSKMFHIHQKCINFVFYSVMSVCVRVYGQKDRLKALKCMTNW